jgi:hypothetical protein
MEVVQSARVIELEQANARLMVELEQANLALAEAEAHRSSLFINYRKLEEECAGLRAAANVLR